MQEDGDILVLGSSRLAKFLMEEGLVDVLKLSISPVSVGGGFRLLEGIAAEFQLQESPVLKSGVLAVTYEIK
ncbi:dihydrofolate reductase family protein [Streptococcus sp. ZY1909104]|uniref:dihydrofolate reductase family protein n=1 Tax=Streptococcus TaxID=1301 RepID=UPI002016445D